MKRNLSEQLLDGLKDASLGPNQRMSGQADGVGAKPRESRDPQQRPLLGLLSNIAVLSVIVSVLIVRFTQTTAEELPQLLMDVVTFRRVPTTAQDNVAAIVAGLVGLLPLVLVDYTICAALCKDAGGRWFLLHALGNLVVAVMSLPDIIFWFKDTSAAMSVAYCKTLPFPGCSDWPTCLIISMHVYHMISFKLSADDLFHHLLFVPLIGGVNFAYPWGVSGNILSFFISGLPGGIDYLMLAAVKTGHLDSYTEKRINCSINTWIRGPGITTFVIIVTGAWLHPPPETQPEDLMPAWLFFTTVGLIFFNGQFYAQRVIGNYYIKKAQDYQKRGIKYVDLHAS